MKNHPRVVFHIAFVESIVKSRFPVSEIVMRHDPNFPLDVNPIDASA